jgi:hypothetical protein
MISGAVANILDFGASTGSSDNSSAIQAAITSLGSAGGTVFVPAGIYNTNTTITLPSNVVLRGAGRGSTSIVGSGANVNATTSAVVGSGVGVIGIYMNGHNSEVTGLTVKNFGCGIYMNTAYWSKVYLARMSECRMGLRCKDGYITSVFENNIDYNKFNVVMEGANNQLTFYANDVDNQIQYIAGGQTIRAPGVFVLSDNGSIIRDNTIESGPAEVGSGIILVGTNQRTVIAGNWFEQNGDGFYSSDIVIGLPDNSYGDSYAASLPEEYSITAPVYATSNVDIRDNFHYAAKNAIICTFFYDTLNISIANETFVGIKGRYNRPVTLFTQSSTSNTKININNCTVFNSADNSIDAEMLSGVQNTFVFLGSGFDNYTYGATLIDGKDLFTKQMSMYQFSQLPGATLSCGYAAPLSGTATSSNNVRCAIGTLGVRTVAGTGQARVTDAVGSTAVMATGSPLYGIALNVFNGSSQGLSYTYSGGTGTIPGSDGVSFPITLMSAPTSTGSNYYTGDYFGYCFMSVTNFNTYFAGATRLQLTDLVVYGTV